VPLTTSRRSKSARYEVKTVVPAGRHCVVRRNAKEAEKDAANRAAILIALVRLRAKRDRALVSNTGFRRYFKTIRNEHFAINPDKVEQNNKFDGIFVPRPHTDLPPLEARGADPSFRAVCPRFDSNDPIIPFSHSTKALILTGIPSTCV
jgi:hypothetical protein